MTDATAPEATPSLPPPPPPPAATAAVVRVRPSPPIQTFPWVYRLGVPLIGFVWFGLGLLFAVMETPLEIAGHTYKVGYLVWIAGATHMLAGIRVVDRAYVGGVLFLGMATDEVSGGIIVAPWLFCKYVEYPLEPVEIQVPDPTKGVWDGPNNERPPGMEEPIRIAFANREYTDLPEKSLNGGVDLKKVIKKDDPLLMRATQNVSFVVRFSIRRATKSNEYGFYDFYVRVGSFTNARVQIKPVGIAKLGEEFNNRSLAEVLADIHSHNTAFLGHMQQSFEPWGVDINTAKAFVHLSKSINEAIASVPIAQAGAIAAASTEIKLTREGQGHANAEEAMIVARGKGTKKYMEDTGIQDAEVAIAAQVADSIAKGPNTKFILPSVEFATLAKTLANSLKGKEA